MSDVNYRPFASQETRELFFDYIDTVDRPSRRVFGASPLFGPAAEYVLMVWAKYGAEHDPNCETPCQCYISNGFPAHWFLMGSDKQMESVWESEQQYRKREKEMWDYYAKELERKRREYRRR